MTYLSITDRVSKIDQYQRKREYCTESLPASLLHNTLKYTDTTKAIQVLSECFRMLPAALRDQYDFTHFIRTYKEMSFSLDRQNDKTKFERNKPIKV